MVDKYNYRTIAEYRPVGPDPKRPYSERQLINKANKSKRNKDDESVWASVGVLAAGFGFGYMLLCLFASM